MKLKSIKLENYRKFKNAYIEFPDGVVGIIGLNGVGKSTIIEAIAWAMYGNQSAIVRTDKKSIKREGSSPIQPCRVELEFELDGNQYKIEREMKGSTYATNARAFVNKKLTATNAKQVTEFIEKTLGMDYVSFFTSVFARQNELDSFSDLEPHKRKKIILRMLKIDSIEKAIEKIKEEKNNRKIWIDSARTYVEDEKGGSKIDKLKIEKKDKEEKNEKISKEIDVLKDEAERLKKEVDFLKEKKDIEERKYKKNNELNNKLELEIQNKESMGERKLELQNELNLLKEKSKRLEEIKEKDKEYEQKKLEKKCLEEQKNKLEEKSRLEKEIFKIKEDLKKRGLKIIEIEEILKDLSNAEKDLEEAMKKKEKNDKKILNLVSEIQEVISEIKNEKNEKIEVENKRNEIKKLGKDSRCPTCERILGEQYENLLKKYEKEIISKNRKIEEMEKDLKIVKDKKIEFERRGEALLKRVEYLREKSKEKSAKESLISQLKKEFVERKNFLKEKEEMIKEIGEATFDDKIYEKIKFELEELSKIHDEIVGLGREIERKGNLENNLKILNEKLKKIEKNIENLKFEIKILGFDERKYNEIKLNFEDRRKEFEDLDKKLIRKEENLKYLNKEIKKLEEKIEELKKIEEKIKNEVIEVQYLEKLIEVLANFKTNLISKIRPSLSTFAEELFSKLTDGKYNEMELDENYRIFIRDNGISYPIERFSGGEVDLANLCLRLAISRIISERSGLQLNFIILDEIFGSQDIYRKRNIIKALNELSKQFRQIFLITHIEDVKDYMGYVINVVEREDGTSHARVLE